MMDKLRAERGKSIQLAEENQDLSERNKNLQHEIGKLLMRIEELEA